MHALARPLYALALVAAAGCAGGSAATTPADAGRDAMLVARACPTSFAVIKLASPKAGATGVSAAAGSMVLTVPAHVLTLHPVGGPDVTLTAPGATGTQTAFATTALRAATTYTASAQGATLLPACPAVVQSLGSFTTR